MIAITRKTPKSCKEPEVIAFKGKRGNFLLFRRQKNLLGSEEPTLVDNNLNFQVPCCLKHKFSCFQTIIQVQCILYTIISFLSICKNIILSIFKSPHGLFSACMQDVYNMHIIWYFNRLILNVKLFFADLKSFDKLFLLPCLV